MSTLIEITDISSDEVRALFYYSIDPADYLPASEDQSRQPDGSGLSPQEIVDLKLGTLIEYVFTDRNNGKDMDKIQKDLEKEYPKEEQAAMDKYSNDFSGVGSTWNGSVWS